MWTRLRWIGLLVAVDKDTQHDFFRFSTIPKAPMTVGGIRIGNLACAEPITSLHTIGFKLIHGGPGTHSQL